MIFHESKNCSKYGLKKLTNVIKFFVILFGFILIFNTISCNRQSIELKNGKWVIKDFPQYTFNPLNSTWDPHIPPTDNCAIFYGKRGTGTHIGVFLHTVPRNIGPYQLITHYLGNDEISYRTVIQPPVSLGKNKFLAACINDFKNLGAKIRALEVFIVIPTRSHLIGFSFKRRIRVNSLDFRREFGDKVIENLQKSIPELEEFIKFYKGFQEISIGIPSIG